MLSHFNQGLQVGMPELVSKCHKVNNGPGVPLWRCGCERRTILKCWNNCVGRSSVWTASAQGWELPNYHASSADLKLTKCVSIEVEDEIIVGSRIPTWRGMLIHPKALAQSCPSCMLLFLHRVFLLAYPQLALGPCPFFCCCMFLLICLLYFASSFTWYDGDTRCYFHFGFADWRAVRAGHTQAVSNKKRTRWGWIKNHEPTRKNKAVQLGWR